MQRIPWLLFFIFSWAKTGLADTHYLAIGETWSQATTPLQELRIEKKGVVSVLDQQDQITFTGKKLGTTRVHLGEQAYKVTVLAKPVRQAQKRLSKWIKGKRGLSLEVQPDHVLIKGRWLRLQDFKSLGSLALPNGAFRQCAKANGVLKKEINAHLNQMMIENNLPPTKLGWLPHWQVHIQNQLKGELSQYKKILEPLGIEVLLHSQQITQRPIVHMQIYVAHIKKNFLREWGVDWPSKVSTQVLAHNRSQLEAFQVSLRGLESSGQGQLLATPSLLIESGETGEFHSGGEFPIRTTTQFNNNVEWKSYGLFVKTRPQANARKHIHIQIDIEMSALDQNLTSDGVPALQRSHIKTQVHMDEPKPVLISGFTKAEASSGRSGLPWLQQIPLFQPLFSNGQIYNDELDLVFILVPKFQQ